VKGKFYSTSLVKMSRKESEEGVLAVSLENVDLVQKVFSDVSFSKELLSEGQKQQKKPLFGASCQVTLDAVRCQQGISKEELTSDFFFSKYFNVQHSGEVQIGNADSSLDAALELAICSMHPGERCSARLEVAQRMVKNGRHGEEDRRMAVTCEIALDSVLNAPPMSKWYSEALLDKAKEVSAAAVRLFQVKRTADAFQKFGLTLTLLTFAADVDRRGTKDDVQSEAQKAALELRTMCYSNLTACHFQWGNYAQVARLATLALEDEQSLPTVANSVKLLYRRGVARLKMKDFVEARKDLVEAHRLDPANSAISQQIGQLRIAEKKQNDQMAKGLQSMFK